MHIKAALLTVLPVVLAHFHVLYPPWRGDAIAETNATISEWFYPCAGFNNASSNRTQWPLKGGAVVWNSSHPSALTYINLGLGDVVTSFNVSLQPVYNETGAGVTCLPNPGAAAIAGLNVTEGQNASVQFITIGESGSALYSCADITFSANAPAVDANVCKNSTGVGGSNIANVNTNSTNSTSGGGSNKTGDGPSEKAVSFATLFALVAAAAFAVV